MELCHSEGYDECHVRPIYSTLGHLIAIIEKLRKEDDPDPDLPRNTIKLLLECESCLDKMAAQGSSGIMALSQVQSRTSSSQSERESISSELDVKNSTMKLKNCEQKLKNFKEKNKKFLEKNIELTSKNRELTDNIQAITKDYNKMKEQQEYSKKRIKQLTQQINQEKMTNGELEIRLQEMEKLKLELTVQDKAVTALRLVCAEKDRRIELLQHRKKKKRLYRNVEKSSRGVKETFFGYEEDSIDSSETSSILSQSTISDEELCDELSREEIEKNYQRLMKEHLELQRLHNILQKYCGSNTMDPERHFKTCKQLESDLFDAMLNIENLRTQIKETKEESSKLKTEVKDIRRSERQLNEKKNELISENCRLKDELVETYEKIDDLEFRIVEIESQNPIPDSYHESGVLETILEEPGEVDINMDSNSTIENMDKDKLVQHVQSLEQTANELQQKVITLQQEKETMETKLKHHGSLEEREQMEVMEAKVTILGKAELISTEKIKELEARNNELKQRLDLKEEFEADVTFEKNLNDTISELQTENDSLTMRCSELEENEEILRNNWEKSAQEHINRIQSLEEKIESLESSNIELKSKLEEQDTEADAHRPSLAIELSEVDQSKDDSQINQTIEFLLHRINNLESTLSSLEEAKNTKIESLQEQIAKLKENEIRLSETVSEMEREEKELKCQLQFNQGKRYSNDAVVQYEGKIHELHRSQENLLEHLDSMEDHESDLKERMREMEEKYERKIDHLEKEIANYIEQEQIFTEKICEFEKFETEMMEKLDAADEENQQLAEENRQLIDKVLKTSQPDRELEESETSGINGQTEMIDQLNNELSEIKTEKCRIDELLQRTETELQQVQSENDDLNERLIELDSSEQECLEKLHKYEHQGAELTHLRKKVDVLEDAEIKLMDRVTELEEIEQGLRAQLDNNNKDVQLCVHDQETDTNDLNDNIPSLSTEGEIPLNDTCVEEFCVKSQALISESKTDHLRCDKQTDTIDLMDVKSDGSNSPGKVTGLFERLQDLENENTSLTEKLSSLTSTDKQVRQLSEKIKMLEGSEDKLMERVMELEEIEDRVKGELRRAKAAENRLAEVEQELSEVQSTMEDMENKVESLELENNTLRNELNSSGVSQVHSEANFEKILELEHAKADLTKEKDSLLLHLSEEKTKALKADNDLKELQNKFNEIQTKLDETENSEKSLKDNLNSLEKEKEKLLDTVDDLEHKVQTSEEDIDQFDMLKDKLEDKIQRLENELAQVEESEFALKKDNIEVHKLNEQLTQGNKDLEGRLEETRNKLRVTEDAKTETESKLENSEKSNVELQSNLESVQKSKDEIEKTIKDAIESKKTAERKMEFAEISRQQMESKLKEMDQLYEEVQSNLENSKKTILSLKRKSLTAETSSMEFQLKVEKANKAKSDAEKQLEIVRKSNSYLQSKVMKGSGSRLSSDNNQNSVESIHTDTCMTCGSNLKLPKQLSTFQGGLDDLVQDYRDQLELDTSSSTDCILPSHLMTLDEPFQVIMKDLMTCKLCIVNRISGLQEQDKSLRDANKLLENHYKSEIEELNKSISTVQKDKVTLQEELSVLEKKNQEFHQRPEQKLTQNVDTEDSSSQTNNSDEDQAREPLTMTGEIEKPEDILRQRIMELEKLEKHLKKQVADLESDREELHDITRKDKALIHEQNVKIRELQLAEKMLKVQVSNYEASENKLYKKVGELENEISKMEDRISDLEILEMRLKELVRKYKLDEEVWLSKSANLETSVSELTVSEYNLKKQLENVQKEKLSYSEKSEYLALRLKELENAEANLVQRMKDQENKEKAMNQRLGELESSGSSTEAQAVELHNSNIVLTQQLNQAIQENGALVHQTSQLQSQLIMLDQQCVSLHEAYSQLKEEKHVLEKSEKDLESKVKAKRLSGVDIEEQLHKLEENEKMLKEKISTLQRSENRLKYKVQQIESFDSQELSEVSESKIPHKLEECQQRLVILRKQNIHLKSRLLEYQNLASSKSVVKLPQKEYKQMEARVALIEHTEAQLHNVEQLNAQLQQRNDQLLQGKQAPETEEEMKILKERLKQNEVHLQIFRQLAIDGQWDEILPILNSVNLIKGYRTVESAGLQTEGRKTVTSMAGQPLEELAKQMVNTDLHMARYPDDQSDDSMVDEYRYITPVEKSCAELEITEDGHFILLNQNKRGTDQSKPTAEEKRKLINDLISHLDKDSDDLDSSIEEIHWKKVESLLPVKSQERKWITVGQATSLHSSRPGDTRNREEELVLGLELPSESEGMTQNGTDSNTSSPVLKRRKFLSADSTDMVKSHSGQHHMMPPSTVSKTPDSLSYYLPSSEQNSGDDMHGFVEEIKSHAAPVNYAAPRSSSLHDSGHVTASTGRGTSLRERILEIGKTLEKKVAPYSEISDEEESLFTWKTKAYEARRNFDNAEKEVKHSKDEINKLEKELEEKCRYIEILEAFVEVLQNLLCNKENKNDKEVLNGIEVEVHRMKQKLTDQVTHSTGSDVTTELKRKERELQAKRNEVDSLLVELRQWQEECRTIEDMRVNALESLHCLEQEVSETHTSEKHLKQDYNQLHEQISTLETNKEDLTKNIAILKARISHLTQKCKEKDSLLRRLKDEFCQGSGKSSALLEELKVMESFMDKQDYDSPSMLSNGKPPDQNDRHLISEQFVQGEIPKNPHFTVVSDYDPSLFSKSNSPRLELQLKKGDNVLITGPLDDRGYFEAEVNGKVGLVPAAYLGRPPVNGHHFPTAKDRRWQQYEKPPNHLDTSPENIVQMYGQLVKQGKSGYSSPKFNGLRKTTGQNINQAVPDPPQDFQAVETERGITLSWKPPATPVTGYKIFVDGKLHRHLTKASITRLVLHSISMDRDHIFGIESVCDRQVSEIIDIFYGDNDSKEDRVLTSHEFIKLHQRQYLGIYDYDPQKQSPRADTSQELAFSAGDSITIYGEERRDGYFYGCVDGQYGLVPSYFVEEIPKTNRQKFNVDSHKYNTR
ncbi:golgin subfamily B member 1-like isoform X2 [Mytilus californianus]|uniref:golgin subfamily B member 1-like isoform X2 n=1 Tax=Mytilus californianus TaxID=6549 RepID=UPI002247D63D|nr:golgin subfamily B member 1-like isoform X2 [Mytilus californianus]